MTDCVVALTTLPADFDTRALGEALVAEGLAACVAILPAIDSVYAWEGVLQHDREQQVVIKTTRQRVIALWDALRERHPYEVPEFLERILSTHRRAARSGTRLLCEISPR